MAAPAADRLAAPLPVRGFAAWAAVMTGVAVDAEYVVAARSKWGLFVAEKQPTSAATFPAEASSLCFDTLEVDKMWSKLSQITVIAARPPDLLTAEEYVTGRDAFAGAVMALRGHRPKTLATPLFGLDAVMFQRGQAPVPALRKPWAARSVHEVDWDHVAATAPVMAATHAPLPEQSPIVVPAPSGPSQKLLAATRCPDVSLQRDPPNGPRFRLTRQVSRPVSTERLCFDKPCLSSVSPRGKAVHRARVGARSRAMPSRREYSGPWVRGADQEVGRNRHGLEACSAVRHGVERVWIGGR